MRINFYSHRSVYHSHSRPLHLFLRLSKFILSSAAPVWAVISRRYLGVSEISLRLMPPGPRHSPNSNCLLAFDPTNPKPTLCHWDNRTTSLRNWQRVICLLSVIWAAWWQNQQSGMCAQRRLRSAWVSAQSDHSLCCPHEESLGP